MAAAADAAESRSRNLRAQCHGLSGPPPASMSPDGTKALFICDWNLWVRDVASGQERQLTTDGVKDFGYATSNAGWTTSAGTALSWSPDGKKIATQQQDERKVGDMYLVETPVNGGHPVLRAWKYPLPGDPVVAMISRVVIDVDTGKITRLLMAPDFHRAMSEDNLDMGSTMEPRTDSRLGSCRPTVQKNSTAKQWNPHGESDALPETEKTHVKTPRQGRSAGSEECVVLAARRHAQCTSTILRKPLTNQITVASGRYKDASSIGPRARCGSRPPARKGKGPSHYLYRSPDAENSGATPDNGTHSFRLAHAST